MRQFVASVTGFGMTELDALFWDEFLDEVMTAIRLHDDLTP